MNIEIISDLDLFEFVKVLLTDKQRYAKCTDKLKSKHFFMTQRMLAKQFPVQINKGNINGLNYVAILDAYHFRLCKDGALPPKWLYTSGGKDSGKNKNQVLYDNIRKDKTTCLAVLESLGIELKSLEDLIKIDYTFVEKEYNSVLLMFAGKVKKTQKFD